MTGFHCNGKCECTFMDFFCCVIMILTFLQHLSNICNPHRHQHKQAIILTSCLLKMHILDTRGLSFHWYRPQC